MGAGDRRAMLKLTRRTGDGNALEFEFPPAGSFTLAGLFSLLFTGLKLTGFIAWPWIGVLAPVWLFIAAQLGILGIILVITAVRMLAGPAGRLAARLRESWERLPHRVRARERKREEYEAAVAAEAERRARDYTIALEWWNGLTDEARERHRERRFRTTISFGGEESIIRDAYREEQEMRAAGASEAGEPGGG